MKLWLTLLGLICCMCAFGQVKEPALKVVPYTDSLRNFELEYPATWEVKQVPGRVLTISSPQVQMKDYSTASINLVIVSVDSLGKNITNKEVLKILESAYENEFSNYKKLSDEFIQVGGYDGVRLLFQCELEHFKLEFMTWTFIDNRKAYVFTCKARAASFDRYRPNFENMIASFKIHEKVQYVPYIDSTYGVRVARPSNWKAVRDTASVISLYSPEEPPRNYSEASMSLIISAAGNANLKELYDQMQKVCAKEYNEYRKVKSEKVIVDNCEGHKMVFTGTRQKQKLEVALYGFLKEGKAYLVTCAAHASYFDRYRPVFDSIVRSFEITGIMKYSVYSDTTYHFTVKYPRGWETFTSTETPLTISSPRLPMQDYADASANMVVVQEDVSMNELLPQLESAYSGQLKSYEKIKSQISSADGDKCIRLYFRGVRNNEKLHYLVYVLQHLDKLYSFTCASREASYGSYEKVFEKMMESIHFQ